MLGKICEKNIIKIGAVEKMSEKRISKSDKFTDVINFRESSKSPQSREADHSTNTIHKSENDGSIQSLTDPLNSVLMNNLSNEEEQFCLGCSQPKRNCVCELLISDKDDETESDNECFGCIELQCKCACYLSLDKENETLSKSKEMPRKKSSENFLHGKTEVNIKCLGCFQPQHSCVCDLLISDKEDETVSKCSTKNVHRGRTEEKVNECLGCAQPLLSCVCDILISPKKKIPRKFSSENSSHRETETSDECLGCCQIKCNCACDILISDNDNETGSKNQNEISRKCISINVSHGRTEEADNECLGCDQAQHNCVCDIISDDSETTLKNKKMPKKSVCGRMRHKRTEESDKEYFGCQFQRKCVCALLIADDRSETIPKNKETPTKYWFENVHYERTEKSIKECLGCCQPQPNCVCDNLIFIEYSEPIPTNKDASKKDCFENVPFERSENSNDEWLGCAQSLHNCICNLLIIDNDKETISKNKEITKKFSSGNSYHRGTEVSDKECLCCCQPECSCICDPLISADDNETNSEKKDIQKNYWFENVPYERKEESNKKCLSCSQPQRNCDCDILIANEYSGTIPKTKEKPKKYWFENVPYERSEDFEDECLGCAQSLHKCICLFLISDYDNETISKNKKVPKIYSPGNSSHRETEESDRECLGCCQPQRNCVCVLLIDDDDREPISKNKETPKKYWFEKVHYERTEKSIKECLGCCQPQPNCVCDNLISIEYSEPISTNKDASKKDCFENVPFERSENSNDEWLGCAQSLHNCICNLLIIDNDKETISKNKEITKKFSSGNSCHRGTEVSDKECLCCCQPECSCICDLLISADDNETNSEKKDIHKNYWFENVSYERKEESNKKCLSCSQPQRNCDCDILIANEYSGPIPKTKEKPKKYWFENVPYERSEDFEDECLGSAQSLHKCVCLFLISDYDNETISKNKEIPKIYSPENSSHRGTEESDRECLDCCQPQRNCVCVLLIVDDDRETISKNKETPKKYWFENVPYEKTEESYNKCLGCSQSLHNCVCNFLIFDDSNKTIFPKKSSFENLRHRGTEESDKECLGCCQPQHSCICDLLISDTENGSKNNRDSKKT